MATLCIIADTHKRHREITVPECDLLIHCGDFCSFQDRDLQTLGDVDDWFSGLPVRNVVCVGGNHDHLLQRKEFEFTHAQYLEDRLIEVAGLKIYGSPWCPDLSGFAYYAREKQLIECWRKIPMGIDILVTHTPPFGILDIPSSGDIHLGCPHLRNELERIQPRLHVFGHIHASHGKYQKSGIQYVNASVVGGPDFEVRNGPATVMLA